MSLGERRGFGVACPKTNGEGATEEIELPTFDYESDALPTKPQWRKLPAVPINIRPRCNLSVHESWRAGPTMSDAPVRYRNTVLYDPVAKVRATCCFTPMVRGRPPAATRT